MKKTLTANISGTVFHIEEDAYDKLQRYLGTIRGQFAGTEGRDEIMADIEARIAELFQERLDGKRQVVSTDDVDHVIGIMGQPEDYMGEEEAPNAADPGAAAGAGQPIWTFANGRKHKRLMRDTEDRWVGGVLSGVAAYFGFDPLILRIVYIGLLFLGIGWLIYIILWIVVPPAGTAAEKLEMRGEPVTVENLKRVFDEGGERIKTGAERVAREADELGKQWRGSEARVRQEEFRRGAARGMSSFFTVLGKLVGVFLLFAGAALGILLIGGLVGGGTLTYDSMMGDTEMGFFEAGGLVFDTQAQAVWMVIAGVLLAVIPIMGLIIAGLRLLFQVRSPRWFTGGLGVVWIAALVLAMVLGIRLGNDFKRNEPLRTEAPLVQPFGQTLFLSDLEPTDGTRKWMISFEDGHHELNGPGFTTSPDSIHGAWAGLDVKRSPDSLFHVIVEREAQARTVKASFVRASHINYTVQQEDSLLRISPWLEFPKADKIRWQRVHFTIQVPLGKAVHFSNTMGYLLDDVKNVTNTYDRDMVGRTWTMTTHGLDGDVRPEAVPDSLPAGQAGAVVAPPSSSTDNGTKTTTIRVIAQETSSTNGTLDEQMATVFRGPAKRRTTTVTTEEPAQYKLPNVLELLFHRI